MSPEQNLDSSLDELIYYHTSDGCDANLGVAALAQAIIDYRKCLAAFRIRGWEQIDAKLLAALEENLSP